MELLRWIYILSVASAVSAEASLMLAGGSHKSTSGSASRPSEFEWMVECVKVVCSSQNGGCKMKCAELSWHLCTCLIQSSNRICMHVQHCMSYPGPYQTPWASVNRGCPCKQHRAASLWPEWWCHSSDTWPSPRGHSHSLGLHSATSGRKKQVETKGNGNRQQKSGLSRALQEHRQPD